MSPFIRRQCPGSRQLPRFFTVLLLPSVQWPRVSMVSAEHSYKSCFSSGWVKVIETESLPNYPEHLCDGWAKTFQSPVKWGTSPPAPEAECKRAPISPTLKSLSINLPLIKTYFIFFLENHFSSETTKEVPWVFELIKMIFKEHGKYFARRRSYSRRRLFIKNDAFISPFIFIFMKLCPLNLVMLPPPQIYSWLNGEWMRLYCILLWKYNLTWDRDKPLLIAI